MQKAQPIMTILSYYIGQGTHFGPSRDEILKVANRGGWVETPMLPLIFVLLKNKDINQQTAENYLHAQIVLIETGMSTGSQRRRRDMMRYYLDMYRKLLDDDGNKLAPSVLDAIHDRRDLVN